MGNTRFDSLVKFLAASPTRRASLGLFAGAGLGSFAALLGVLQIDVGDAVKNERSKRKRKQRKRKKRRDQERGQPPPSNDPPPPTTTTPAPTTTTNAPTTTTTTTKAPPTTTTPPPPGCPEGTKPCNGTCIANTSCCTNSDCPEGTTCQSGDCLGTGAPLFPELRTRAAFDLSFDQKIIDGEQVYLLRFSNTIWNAGEGRLELESEPLPHEEGKAKKIYQNLYDAPIGGTLVRHKQVASDIIYHPEHQHFHFANFASYLLLARDATGVYQETTKKGTKTSFCIYDYQHFEGPYPKQYTSATCGLEVQGLTPGWGDTYHAVLADQWIVVGPRPLGDGEYAVQSTANPKRVIDEGGKEREGNNTAVTYFTVSGGLISNVRNAP
jgi:hypothetical protein